MLYLAGADDVPPPKPSRQPQNTTEQSLLSAAPVSTYIVAQSPEVLAQLLKDNQARGVCPSVYTTPASPFNTLAVQFQDEDQILTTALVSDLPFFDPALSSEPPSLVTHDTTTQSCGGDSTLSDSTNLDSLDSSSLDTPLMSSLSISDCTQTAVAQQSSPAVNRKQQKVKEMQNLYAISTKVMSSNVTGGDLYSPVQKFSASNVAAAAAPATCGEIYGPVASFTQSSAIVGNLSQSASVGGNYGENPGNFGPSSLSGSVVIPDSSNNSQTQLFTGGSSHAQSQPINHGNFATSNNTSQVFGSGVGAGVGSGGGGGATAAAVVQNANCAQSAGIGGGSSNVIYARNVSSTSAGSATAASSTECLYGPVLKFRAQTAQSQTAATDLKSQAAGALPGFHVQAGRNNQLPAVVQSMQQSQSMYSQNYAHQQQQQQIYSNIAQPGQAAVYVSQMQQVQHVSNVARQNAAVTYAVIHHTNQQQQQQQSQPSGMNPIYTARATSVSVVQAQKVHLPNYAQQAQSAISGGMCQMTGANQAASIGGVMQQASSSVPSHFIAASSAIQQNIIHPIPTGGYIMTDQQQPSSLRAIDHSQVHVGSMMTSIAHQQPQMTASSVVVKRTENVSQIATGVAKITMYTTSQKQEEQLTSSTDGTLSGSLISSAVSDSTMSSSSSMTEEAQQDQV